MRCGSRKQWNKYLAKLGGYRATKLLARQDDKLSRSRKRNGAGSYAHRQSLGSHYARSLAFRPTAAELAFGNVLCELEIFPFHFQKAVLKPRLYILDFYLPQYDVVFEIDGASHSGKELYDKERDDTLLVKRGFQTHRFTNDEVFGDTAMLKSKITTMLKGKHGPVLEEQGLPAYLTECVEALKE